MVEPLKFTEIEAIFEKMGIPEFQRVDLREAIEISVSDACNEKCEWCPSLHPEMNIDAMIAAKEKEDGKEEIEKEGILLDGIIEKEDDDDDDDDDDEIDDEVDDEDEFPPGERKDGKELVDDVENDIDDDDLLDE